MKKEKIYSHPSPEEIKKLSQKISEMDFWTYVRLSDTMQRYLEITMKKDKLSPLQTVAMWLLVIAGGTATPTQLARMMYRSKHSITQIVDNLEAEGLIIRENTPKDRRVTYVNVTNAGLERVKENFKLGNKHAQEVIGCLDAAEQKVLRDLTEKLRKRMIQILESA
jgi:MarR family transcriptional regulator, 2-MHQ and catechol-resistance regulon repressor